MPIRKVRGGYKWGKHGHVYKTRRGAEVQARAAYANGYHGDTRNDAVKLPMYPADHHPISPVPKDGARCGTCKYLSSDGLHCESEYFQQFHGTDLLPMPADEMCSDWWEMK